MNNKTLANVVILMSLLLSIPILYYTSKLIPQLYIRLFSEINWVLKSGEFILLIALIGFIIVILIRWIIAIKRKSLVDSIISIGLVLILFLVAAGSKSFLTNEYTTIDIENTHKNNLTGEVLNKNQENKVLQQKPSCVLEIDDKNAIFPAKVYVDKKDFDNIKKGQDFDKNVASTDYEVVLDL